MEEERLVQLDKLISITSDQITTSIQIYNAAQDIDILNWRHSKGDYPYTVSPRLRLIDRTCDAELRQYSLYLREERKLKQSTEKSRLRRKRFRLRELLHLKIKAQEVASHRRERDEHK